MQITKAQTVAEYVLGYLPPAMAREIRTLCRVRRGGLSAVREIRIRKSARCSLLFPDESLPLSCIVGEREMEEMIRKISDGALYAHRDSIAGGYISLDFGVRVGLVGVARYEGERLAGVSSFSSVVFRIPGGECAFSEELCEVFYHSVRRGMIIYSPPGVGKTTALRSLAASLGVRMRVAVIDERREFYPDDYRALEVDILSGYKKAAGLEIATRTMSPEVLFIDEIGGGEVEALLGVVRCGIPLVATAHAGSVGELLLRRNLQPLFECGAFDVAVGISRESGGYRITESELSMSTQEKKYEC